jgi:NCAIR mutase (PurE)-related protein
MSFNVFSNDLSLLRRSSALMTGIELGWELDLGVAGVSRALKRVESAFRENAEIKQRILSARAK